MGRPPEQPRSDRQQIAIARRVRELELRRGAVIPPDDPAVVMAFTDTQPGDDLLITETIVPAEWDASRPCIVAVTAAYAYPGGVDRVLIGPASTKLDVVFEDPEILVEWDTPPTPAWSVAPVAHIDTPAPYSTAGGHGIYVDVPETGDAAFYDWPLLSIQVGVLEGGDTIPMDSRDPVSRRLSLPWIFTSGTPYVVAYVSANTTAYPDDFTLQVKTRVLPL